MCDLDRFGIWGSLRWFIGDHTALMRQPVACQFSCQFRHEGIIYIDMFHTVVLESQLLSIQTLSVCCFFRRENSSERTINRCQPGSSDSLQLSIFVVCTWVRMFLCLFVCLFPSRMAEILDNARVFAFRIDSPSARWATQRPQCIS